MDAVSCQHSLQRQVSKISSYVAVSNSFSQNHRENALYLFLSCLCVYLCLSLSPSPHLSLSFPCSFKINSVTHSVSDRVILGAVREKNQQTYTKHKAHTWYLSFFLHKQNLWRIKFTPKNANFSRLICKKLHFFAQNLSKMPIFRVKSVKIYTGQKKSVTNIRYARNDY